MTSKHETGDDEKVIQEYDFPFLEDLADMKEEMINLMIKAYSKYFDKKFSKYTKSIESEEFQKNFTKMKMGHLKKIYAYLDDRLKEYLIKDRVQIKLNQLYELETSTPDGEFDIIREIINVKKDNYDLIKQMKEQLRSKVEKEMNKIESMRLESDRLENDLSKSIASTTKLSKRFQKNVWNDFELSDQLFE